MPIVLLCSRWIALLLLLLHVPATTYGQMEQYNSGYGMNPAMTNASGGLEWFNSMDDGFDSIAFDSDTLDPTCGCNELSPANMDSFPGGIVQTSYEQACEMPMPAPYGYDTGVMMPRNCDSGAPLGTPSACSQCNGFGSGGCGESGYGCQTCCPCGNAAPVWFGAEAISWHTTGSSLPPLMTTSENGTQQFDAGVIGRPATQVLYGGNNIFNGMRGGFRLRGGVNFDQCGIRGLDLEYFMLGTRRESFHGDSAGDPILARPFLNAETGLNDAQLLAYPDLATGTIDIMSRSSLNSGALHYREVFWKECDPGNSCPDNCRRSGPRSFTMGFQIGPRFINLKESVTANEQLTGVENANQYSIQDSFRTKNQFWGCELGLFGTRQRRRWSLDGGVRLAVGGTNQKLNVDGQTAVTQDGVTTTSAGGFLAQRTNSGSFERNRFTLLPQFDVGIGYQMTNTWRASVGYSLLYWGSVLRATEQIDPVINPGLLPPEQNPLTGDLRPASLMQDSSYLAHGITFGLERRW